MAETFFKTPSIRSALLAVALVGAVPLTLAQGLDSEGAIDTIVGSDVKTEERNAADEGERVAIAIEASMDNAQIVRRAYNVEGVDIVLLPGVGEGGSDISAKRDEFADQIVELQQAVEGSAIFYHGINSRRILVRDVVALEFADENKNATIFVVGVDPGSATSGATDASRNDTAEPT